MLRVGDGTGSLGAMVLTGSVGTFVTVSESLVCIRGARNGTVLDNALQERFS